MKLLHWMIGLSAAFLLAAGCDKPEENGGNQEGNTPGGKQELDSETKLVRRAVNTFAWNVMDYYYLWRDEITSELDSWRASDDPIPKVARARYKDAAGKDIDRWTMLTDDYASVAGGVSGHTRTVGLDFQLYYVDETHANVCAVVTYTYAGGPAELAGIVRGDAISSVNGQEMTPKNYVQLIQEGLLGGGTVKLGLLDGRSFTLTAVDMYENPIQTVRILNRPDGRKVGYLHYTSFTLDSCEELTRVMFDFTDEGIDDLVLDLRYNGGGYIVAEEVLASMLAPLAAVEAESVYYREIYNSQMTKDEKPEPILFQTAFTFRNNGAMQIVSTAGSNPDLPRLYVLVTGSSASASECLVCGLHPYMDVTLVGERTSGKYCAGYMMSATSWYESVKKSFEEEEYKEFLPRVENWGIYVMYSRYADCNGVTLSMPDGIVPDVPAEDDPLDGYPLGDPRESMLSVALGLIEGGTRSAASPAHAPSLEPVSEHFHPRSTGLRVRDF